eukprot:GEMP01020326.1.p1 GENE.GEMP01020326.1~~GEMP01020326.1.p1  ORF type:complete len:146 (+),score=21.11 GEMP01020326.1:292-729(+)
MEAREPFLAEASAPPLNAASTSVALEHRMPSAPPSPIMVETPDNQIAVLTHHQQPLVYAVGAPVPNSLPRYPYQCNCPHCGEFIQTIVQHKVGTETWVITVVLCFLSCGVLSFLPFCINGLKDVRHSCPHCHNSLGSSPPSARWR